MLLLLLLPALALGQNSTCCPKKIHSGNSYILSGEDASTVTMYGCLDSCVYEMAGTPGSRYCFKAGGLETTCDNGAGTTPSTFKCGVKKPGTKIVGGTETQVLEYPWMVGLKNKTGGFYYCGGTLIAKQWVLTAAHCCGGLSPEEGPPTKVVIGAHTIQGIDGNRLEVSISKLIPHPSYVVAKFDFDIALLKLSENVDLTVYTPACLPSSEQSFVGKTAYAYGWGRIVDIGPPSPVLLDVAVPVVSLATCQAAMGANRIRDGMLCAGGEKGMDACGGDSGGPLTVADNGTGQHTLIGATSWGDACAQAGKYGVYADVAFYRSWIDEQFTTNGGASFTP